MNTQKMETGGEKPVSQDVDDLIFGADGEWCASER